MRLEIIYKLGFLIFLIFFYLFFFSDDVSAADINWAIQPGASASCLSNPEYTSLGDCNNVRDNNNNTFFGVSTLGGASYTATVYFNQTAPIINKVEILLGAGIQGPQGYAMTWIDLYYQGEWREVAIFGGFRWSPPLLSSKTGDWSNVSAIRVRAQVFSVNASTSVATSATHITYELRAWGAESLFSNLSASPASGPAPLTSTLTATVSGSATGTINYTFWWNCNNLSASVSDVITACGNPTDPNFGAKFDNIMDLTKSIDHIYDTAGTYYPKVIVERGGLAETDVKTVTVSVPVNNNPQVTPSSVNQNLFTCSAPSGETSLTPVLNWTYFDPDGDPQDKYQIIIKQGAVTIHDSGQVVSLSSYYNVPSGKLSYNNSYDWTIQVWDLKGGTSDPVSGTSFSTIKHDLPYPRFQYFPDKPLLNSNTLFCSIKEGDCAVKVFTETTCPGSTCESWLWTINLVAGSFVSPSANVSKNPVIKFILGGNQDVTLKVTDADNYSCETTNTINFGLPLPIFKEK